MLDALLYAARDSIRAANIGYGRAECEIMDDGRPPPRVGNVFASVHDGRSRPGQGNDNNLFELLDFSVTLTMRVTVPLDRVGDQLIARNIALVPTGQRQGFNAKVEQLRGLLHMNWGMVVLTGQTPSSANDNLVAWSAGAADQVYGFSEPARYQGAEVPALVGGEWLGADPDSQDLALKSELRFAGAKRFQPQRSPRGAFV